MTEDLYQEVKEYIKEIIRESRWNRKVYVVGGCVRDSLLGQEISDIDLFVNLPRGALRFVIWLRETDKIVPEYQYFRRFGTAKVRFKQFPDLEIDISAPHHNEVCRKGNKYTPEQALTHITQDCLLRDLTINALYQNISTGKIMDFSKKGLKDLKNHIIRTTSEPQVIYESNPACMIRTVRFAVKYGWEMAAETRKGLFRLLPLLLEQSRPARIYKEYGKVLASPKKEAMQQIFLEMGVLDFLEETWKQEDALEQEKQAREIRNAERRKALQDQKQARRKRNLEKQRQEHEAALQRRRMKRKKHQERMARQKVQKAQKAQKSSGN